jgi:hypothetical protein
VEPVAPDIPSYTDGFAPMAPAGPVTGGAGDDVGELARPKGARRRKTARRPRPGTPSAPTSAAPARRQPTRVRPRDSGVLSAAVQMKSVKVRRPGTERRMRQREEAGRTAQPRPQHSGRLQHRDLLVHFCQKPPGAGRQNFERAHPRMDSPVSAIGLCHQFWHHRHRRKAAKQGPRGRRPLFERASAIFPHAHFMHMIDYRLYR